MSCIVEKGEALSFKESRQNQAVKSGVGPPASNFPPGFAPLPAPSRQGRRVLPLPLAASLRTPPVLRPRHALCHPARRSREIPERFLLRSQPLYSIPPPAAPLRRSAGKKKKKSSLPAGERGSREDVPLQAIWSSIPTPGVDFRVLRCCGVRCLTLPAVHQSPHAPAHTKTRVQHRVMSSLPRSRNPAPC